ncbi:MAG: hypothetical protein PHF56_11685 [Desulfuromonadaceae bacterium]|nr:hypothetical protein [Desulfuromonadaceae bacterium]
MSTRKLILQVAGVVAVGLFFYFDLAHFLTLSALKANRQSLLGCCADLCCP